MPWQIPYLYLGDPEANSYENKSLTKRTFFDAHGTEQMKMIAKIDVGNTLSATLANKRIQ